MSPPPLSERALPMAEKRGGAPAQGGGAFASRRFCCFREKGLQSIAFA